jgi:hypothetical protein
MVNVVLAVLVVPLGVTELELREQLMRAEAGAVQVRETAPLNPFLPSTVMVEVAVPPGAAMVATVPYIWKSATVVLPLLQAFARLLTSSEPRPVTRS